MATAYFDFTVPDVGNFQFQPTLDGAVYNCIATWNMFGQRWYINCYDLNGVRIFSLPIIGSPLNYDISITAGYFASKMVFRTASNQFEISP